MNKTIYIKTQKCGCSAIIEVTEHEEHKTIENVQVVKYCYEHYYDPWWQYSDNGNIKRMADRIWFWSEEFGVEKGSDSNE